MTLEEFILNLIQNGVTLLTVGDKLKYTGPEEVLTDSVIRTMAKHKHEIITWLANPTITVTTGGKKAKLYRQRPECLKAGYCLRFTNDCDLFPLTWLKGWCRERVSMSRPQRKARGGDKIFHSSPTDRPGPRLREKIPNELKT